MRIQYISDIHLEFLSKLLKPARFSPQADILCLAGDIGYPFSPIYKQFLKHVNQQFKKIFLITGNHEYYHPVKSMDNIHTHIKQIIHTEQLENISFLDNSYEDYEGVRFAGTTLWTKIDYNPDVFINDFNQIPEMTTQLYNELYTLSCEFLESQDIQSSPLPVVILSHHLPLLSLIDPKYAKYNKYNQFFASDCSRLFSPCIKAWIYGHTHSENYIIIDNIQFACNPVGYPSESERKMSYNSIIELI